MGAVIYRLTGTEEARGWLELARAAETIKDIKAFVELHGDLMRKVKIEGAPAIRVPERPQLRQTAKSG